MKMRHVFLFHRAVCDYLIVGTYKAVGSNGYEKQDVDWMVTYAGADYLKVRCTRVAIVWSFLRHEECFHPVLCCFFLCAACVQVDSCCGSQDHATAFSDYAKFRDALNATGVPVYLSLCGWKSWYAPPDPSIGYTGGASLGAQSTADIFCNNGIHGQSE